MLIRLIWKINHGCIVVVDGHIYPEFIAGVRRFINFSFSIDENVSGGKIRCHCVRCKNQKFLIEEDVYKHMFLR